MANHARIVPAGQPIVERWFLKMESSLAHRQNLLVVPMNDGSVIAVTRYANMAVYLAGRELIEDIRNILSHIRAAARESARGELGVTVSELEELIGRSQKLLGELRAEQVRVQSHGL